MEKIIQFKPAFDKRDPNPLKNYGIHCMEMYMVLKGELGAISFCVYTGWYLQHIEEGSPANGAAICYHSYKPKYEDQAIGDKCEYLNNSKCYCDCSYIAAGHLFNEFVEKGDCVVWQELENRYISNFKELK